MTDLKFNEMNQFPEYRNGFFFLKEQSIYQNTTGMNLRLSSVQLYWKKIWQKYWKASWLGRWLVQINNKQNPSNISYIGQLL